MKALFVVLLLATAFAAIPTAVTNCMSNPSITFTAATFSVEPAKGVDETMTLYGTANAHAELANVQMKAKWNGVDVFEDNFEEDDVYDEGDPIVYAQTANFPTYTPSGKITVQFWFQNAKGTSFGCAQISFTI